MVVLVECSLYVRTYVKTIAGMAWDYLCWCVMDVPCMARGRARATGASSKAEVTEVKNIMVLWTRKFDLVGLQQG